MQVLKRSQLRHYGLLLAGLLVTTLLFWPERWRELMASGAAMPHGSCYLWDGGLIGLHVSSDMVIGLSYLAISATLCYLVYRARRDIPFTWVFIAFGLFIVACGGTHFMEVWTVWQADYWASGYLKVVTAIASVTTALALPPLVPKTLGLVEAAKLSEERQAKVEAANRELEALYDRLKELDQLKTQFFANVSHELRTPLALIIGPAERMLAESPLGERERRDLEVVARNARTLLKHVNDLLDVSKLEAGKMGLDYAEADLARLLRLTASHFEGLAQERQIELHVDAPDALPAELDAEKVQRVFLNLLSNAFKFTPAGGRLRCALRRDGGRAVAEFHDSGPGVPPHLREAIFERFRQGDGGATRRFGGTGLGLSITREFVGLHGGTVEVGDSPEGGALFTVTLPTSAPAGVEVRRAAEAAPGGREEAARQAMEELRTRVEAAAAEQQMDRPLVLVVEDNPEMNRFVAETLAAECRVATAFDGEQGLERALALRPDLILSDVMMPRLSGDQLVRRLRERAEFDAVPVVLLTAKADDELRVRLLREGAQDYVMKPFSAEELRARVSNLVTIKRAREVLQRELDTQLRDLESLAKEVTFRKRELQTSYEEMRFAREQAERASQVKSDFLRLVSHELRTPLTAISGYLEVLRRAKSEGLSEPQRQLVGKIGRSANRLRDLVESLLEYTRIQSGRLVVHPEPLDLAALAADVADELRPQAEQKGITLAVESAAPLAPLLSDARLVRLVLVNLIGNAVKFTGRGGVTVSVAQGGGRHAVSVADTGPGIRPEHRALVFEPFGQVGEVDKKHLPGFGLGLALVRQIVDALGGEVELHSEEGRGATFTVSLPPAAAGGKERPGSLTESIASEATGAGQAGGA
jgi:signal transduction histidine kinase